VNDSVKTSCENGIRKSACKMSVSESSTIRYANGILKSWCVNENALRTTLYKESR
jgi:hypothetical protein